MLGRETWFALVVKNKNAGQEVFEEGGEITRQIKLAFEVPYKDAKAEEHYINTYCADNPFVASQRSR